MDRRRHSIRWRSTDKPLFSAGAFALAATAVLVMINADGAYGDVAIINHTYRLNANGSFSPPGKMSKDVTGTQGMWFAVSSSQLYSNSNTSVLVSTGTVNGTLPGYFILFESDGNDGSYAATGISLIIKDVNVYVASNVFTWSPLQNHSSSYVDEDAVYTQFATTVGALFRASSSAFSNLSATYAGSSNGSLRTWGKEEGQIAYGIRTAGSLLPTGVSSLSVALTVAAAHSIENDTWGGELSGPAATGSNTSATNASSLRVIGNNPGCLGNYGCMPDGWCFDTFLDHWYECFDVSGLGGTCFALSDDLAVELAIVAADLIDCAADGGLSCFLAAAEAVAIAHDDAEWTQEGCPGTPCSYPGEQFIDGCST